MYGVLGALLLIMVHVSALQGGVRLPWSRRVGRYKIELLPIAEEECEVATVRMSYPLAILDPGQGDLSKRSDGGAVGGRASAKLNLDQELPQPKNCGSAVAPGVLRRRARTSWKAMSSPIRSFINETFIRLRRKKRKKKRRKNVLYVPDSNLKINISISEPKIYPSVKSAYVRGTGARKNGFDCTCDVPFDYTTKPQFILTQCECEADYEITEYPEKCEEGVEEQCSQDGNFCDQCARTKYENGECARTDLDKDECETEVAQNEECCVLDPIPKHTAIDCEVSTEDTPNDYPTYKTYPFSGCRHKKKQKSDCENCETTVEKGTDPDLSQIFSIPGSTIATKTVKEHNSPNKKNGKNSKIKGKKKYSKPKRKNSRITHFRRKESTKKYKNGKRDKPESPKKFLLENILSRIRGRSNTEESTTTDEVSTIAENEETEEDDGGCNCSELRTTLEEIDNTGKSTFPITPTWPNEMLIDDMFRRFLGESVAGTLESWVVTEPANKDESVTLIINVEDEVIAPPPTHHSQPVANPLSAAVEEMLAQVKYKMTQPVRTTTPGSMATEYSMTASKSASQTGIKTAERLKLMHRSQSTTSTQCRICNSQTEEEEENASSSNSEEQKTEEYTVRTLMTGKPPKERPVTDADYDQIISLIHCNLSDDRRTTVDILRQLCEDRYGSISPSDITSSEIKTETKKDSVDYDADTLETSSTKKTLRTEQQSFKTQKPEDSFRDEEDMTTTSKKHVKTSKDSEQHLSDDDNTHVPLTASLRVITTGNSIVTTSSDTSSARVSTNKKITSSSAAKADQEYAGRSNYSEAAKYSEASGGVPTICFAISDFIESDRTTTQSKTVKAWKTSLAEEAESTSEHPEEENSSPHPQEERTVHHTHEERTVHHTHEERTDHHTQEERTVHHTQEESTAHHTQKESAAHITHKESTAERTQEKSTVQHTQEESTAQRTQEESNAQRTQEESNAKHTRGHKTTPSPQVDETKEMVKDEPRRSTPRPCNCTIPDSASSQTQRSNTRSKKSTTPVSTKSSPAHENDTAADLAEALEAGTEQVSEMIDNEKTETSLHTTKKHKLTTSQKKPKKEKEKLEKPAKFKFYPPLSLYRTWLSPWAAVQINNQRPPQLKPPQFNNGSCVGEENEEQVLAFPRQPDPLAWAMSQPLTNSPSSNKSRPGLGGAKGVYVGAIIMGNKHLPSGFYKLEDLKKLKSSGIPIPKIRGKKTISNSRIAIGRENFSLRRISPKGASDVHRGKKKRKIINSRFGASNGQGIYSIAKLPKGRIGRKSIDRLSHKMKGADSKARGKY